MSAATDCRPTLNYRVAFNDFRYASTDSASIRVIANLGIGGRGGSPVREMPVIMRVTNCSSVPGGTPANRGATCAQFGAGIVDSNTTGAPRSHRARSGSARSVRGVWHVQQTPTPSTRYLPRSTEPRSAANKSRETSGDSQPKNSRTETTPVASRIEGIWLIRRANLNSEMPRSATTQPMRCRRATAICRSNALATRQTRRPFPISSDETTICRRSGAARSRARVRDFPTCRVA